MNKPNSTLSDSAFLSAFESCALSHFRHRDHIRAARIYLARFPFPEASRRMAESVRRFAAHHGATEKYHETITQAWMHLVWKAMEEDDKGWRRPSGLRTKGEDDFPTFAAAHPDLLEVKRIYRFYSAELLSTSLARTQFLPPDVTPLP
jgi:hypothetical protein